MIGIIPQIIAIGKASHLPDELGVGFAEGIGGRRREGLGQEQTSNKTLTLLICYSNTKEVK